MITHQYFKNTDKIKFRDAVIVSGMEAYIPHSFSQSKPPKPWFNAACSRTIHDREVAH